MRILKNTEILKRQSSNLMLGELSNIAMVLQTQLLIIDYFSIDAMSSEYMKGFKNVHDYINEESTVQYNLIQGMPMAGIDNLLMMSDFEDDMGQVVDYTATGMVFPNTVKPKANDLFIIAINEVPTLFIITKVSQNTIRDIACFEVEISLRTQSATTIAQLYRQIKDRYRFTVSSIGADKNLIMKEETYFNLKDHINSYVDLCDAYKSLFFDYNRSIFIYKDVLYHDDKVSVIDLMLLKFLYVSGVIIYDDVITYSNNNYEENIETIYMDIPPIIDMHNYKISVFNRFIEKNKSVDFSENRFAIFVEYSPQITKFTGIKIMYSENYTKSNYDELSQQFNIFDDDFINRIKTNSKYIDTNNVNMSLRNALISYYNDEEINFNDIEIQYEKTLENFYLVPILLCIYKTYISSMK